MNMFNWMLHLVPLDALTAYLADKGWQRQAHPNQAIQVYAKESIVYDDGTRIEIVLPRSQAWDWPSYREAAIELIAAVEGREPVELVRDLIGHDISQFRTRFAAANPPPESVPF